MARRFAQAGSRVVVADIDADAGRAVADAITDGGGSAIAVATDVADPAANDALLAAALDAYGEVNIVCLNAGVTGAVGRSWTLTVEDWRWSLGVLLDGVVNGVRSFVPHLVTHGDGHVVITASIAGHVSSPYSAPYAVAKHGVAALAESLHHELQADGSTVGVTCLCPGFVDTNIVAAARAGGGDGAESADRDDRGARWLDLSERFLRGGLDPAVVGDLVHDAVLTDQFWLFTDEAWDGAISLRAQEITERLPPTIGRPDRSRSSS